MPQAQRKPLEGELEHIAQYGLQRARHVTILRDLITQKNKELTKLEEELTEAIKCRDRLHQQAVEVGFNDIGHVRTHLEKTNTIKP